MALLQLLHTTRQHTHTHKHKSCILKVCGRRDAAEWIKSVGGVEDIKKRREEKRKEGRERQVGGGMTHC